MCDPKSDHYSHLAAIYNEVQFSRIERQAVEFSLQTYTVKAVYLLESFLALIRGFQQRSVVRVVLFYSNMKSN